MADERTKLPYNQPSAVPAKYNWPTLLKKDGDDLFDHYRYMLESLGNEKGLLGLNRFSTFRHPLAVTIQLS
jgi:type I restriction enzyme M protein